MSHSCRAAANLRKSCWKHEKNFYKYFDKEIVDQEDGKDVDKVISE